MSQDELAFERYLKRCKELHEEWHPGAKYEQDKFKDFALQKWNAASDTEKDNFREKVKKTGFQAPFSQTRNPTAPATEPFRTSQTPFATFSTGKYLLTSEKNPKMYGPTFKTKTDFSPFFLREIWFKFISLINYVLGSHSFFSRHCIG